MNYKLGENKMETATKTKLEESIEISGQILSRFDDLMQIYSDKQDISERERAATIEELENMFHYLEPIYRQMKRGVEPNHFEEDIIHECKHFLIEVNLPD